MKIVNFENTEEAIKALKFYKKMRIKKDDLYQDSWNCNCFDGYKVILDFDDDCNEIGQLIKIEDLKDD